MKFRHISVIALPRPGLPWGFTLDTRGTLPKRAKNPPILATPNIPLELRGQARDGLPTPATLGRRQEKPCVALSRIRMDKGVGELTHPPGVRP